MEIFLSKQCESFTGTPGQGYGYAIRKRGKRFYSVRCSKGSVPPDGHWRFILACAKLAQSGLYMTDIQITAGELEDALYEATHYVASRFVRARAPQIGKHLYNARDIINLKHTFGL